MLQSYLTDTLGFIDTVTEFSNRKSKWTLHRETELDLMRDIQERASRINLTMVQVLKSTDKGEAIGQYFRGRLSSGNRRLELENELASVLKNTLEGIETLTDFLEAVEKLAVTSVHVFTVREEVVKLPPGISLQSIEEIISAARLVCPLLLQFKRDAGVFFQPSLHNVAVFVAALDKYICVTEEICSKMKISVTAGLGNNGPQQPAVDFADDVAEKDLQRIIQKLSAIRKDQDFRLVFLFQEKTPTGFVNQFTECHPRMLQFLDDMEESAIQLDRMSMGSKISNVTGSSVGAIGGVLTIVGLALAPVTAGVSLGLTLTGVGLGVTSGVNSVVTTITEISVNNTQQKRASEDLEKFMEDVNHIQVCLDEVTGQREVTSGPDYCHAFASGAKVAGNASAIGKGIDVLVDSLDDVGTAAARGPAALSGAARAGFITLNALFLGLDIFIICKDSVSLAKGDKSQVAQFIRARVALLRSELHAWQRMHECLARGGPGSESSRTLLLRSLDLEQETTMSDEQSDPLDGNQTS